MTAQGSDALLLWAALGAAGFFALDMARLLRLVGLLLRGHGLLDALAEGLGRAIGYHQHMIDTIK